MTDRHSTRWKAGLEGLCRNLQSSSEPTWVAGRMPAVLHSRTHFESRQPLEELKRTAKRISSSEVYMKQRHSPLIRGREHAKEDLTALRKSGEGFKALPSIIQKVILEASNWMDIHALFIVLLFPSSRKDVARKPVLVGKTRKEEEVWEMSWFDNKSLQYSAITLILLSQF